MEENVKISKRISAFLLDIFFVYLLISLITSIKFINPNYDKFVKTYEKYNEVLENYSNKKISLEEMNEQNKENLFYITKYSISSNIVIIVVIFAYFGLFQKYNRGQTLGKKITKIKVIGNDNKELSLVKYFLRIIPTYYIFIGNVVSIFLNSIVIFFVNSKVYSIYNTITVYSLFGIGLISFGMMLCRKDKKGLHDLLVGSKVVYEEAK